MNATATAEARHPDMLEKIEKGQGFIAALDQSGGSTPGALKAYGIGEDAFSNDEEMFGLIHQMRSRIITSPSFGSGKVTNTVGTMTIDIPGSPYSVGDWVPTLVLSYDSAQAPADRVVKSMFGFVPASPMV